MKFLIHILLFLTLAASAQAAPEYTTFEGKYGTKYVYIPGLKADLFQEYKIKDSRGPKWGDDADEISNLVDEDFYERHTYWYEDGFPDDQCSDFTEEEKENAYEEGYGVTWESIKKVKGSKKTVFYLATYTISIGTNTNSCTYEQTGDKYVFLNKKDKDGNPIYLGYLSLDPPPKK